MPWVEQLPSGLWRACWRDAAGRRRSTTKDPRDGRPITAKPRAARIAGEQEGRSRRGEPSESGRAPTWGSWCPTWLAGRVVEPSTAAIDALRIDRYLTPQWERHRVNRITRGEVQAWVNELARRELDEEGTRLAPATVEKIYRLFSASMTAAVLDEHVPVVVNPCAGVKLPVVPPGKERFLTRDEVEGVCFHLNHPYRLAVLLAVGTGLRWGELAGLHWQRVDLDNRVIDVVETWDPTARRIKTYPKGHNRRGVPLVGWVVEALEQAREVAAPARECSQLHAAGGARCRSSLVLTGDLGAPLNGKNFGRRQFREAVALAGVDEGVTLHDLRHTCASWLVQGGVDLYEVQRVLGHASIITTQRYAHLGMSQRDKVIAPLG